eukprot:maker-scaffold238_size242079-snap-gene-1.21 protein:Tk10924 transcript:maker-scaffold238_size242079-snap-gene-1.21-mRNA-1 annotation:"faint sausage "
MNTMQGPRSSAASAASLNVKWLTLTLMLTVSIDDLSASSSRTRHKHSLQSDFLITYANATVYLGCHLPQEQIGWLHNGEPVSGIEYTVKELKENVISYLEEEKVKPAHGRRFRSEYLPKSERHVLAIEPVVVSDIGTWTCHALASGNGSIPSKPTRHHQHGRAKSGFVDRKHNERDSWSLIVLPSLEEPHVFNGEGEKRYTPAEKMGPTSSLSEGGSSSLVAPSSSSSSSDETVISVQEGDELTLLCAMLVKLKHQRDASLKWNSSFFDVSSQFSKEFFVQNNADLKAVISVVTLRKIERGGNRQELACLGLGSHQDEEAVMAVQVQYPPTFTISRTPRFGVPIVGGMTVSLECRADVQPPMTGSWLKDEMHMASTNGTLIIDSVSIENVGWYQCYIAYNGEEYSSIGYFLNVKARELSAQDTPREIQSALSPNISEASFASLKTSQSPNPDSLDLVAKNVLYSESQNCSQALLDLLSEQRYRLPQIQSRNNQSQHSEVVLDSPLTLSFEVCANPKPSRILWVTPVYSLRPGQVSPDFNLIAHNVSRSRTNVTCHVTTLEVKRVTSSLLGEYVLVASNQFGVQDNVLFVSLRSGGNGWRSNLFPTHVSSLTVMLIVQKMLSMEGKGGKAKKSEKTKEKPKKTKGSKSSDGNEDKGKGNQNQVDILDPGAMANALNICHNVQDLLYFRGFSWEGQTKKGKSKARKGGGKKGKK